MMKPFHHFAAGAFQKPITPMESADWGWPRSLCADPGSSRDGRVPASLSPGGMPDGKCPNNMVPSVPPVAGFEGLESQGKQRARSEISSSLSPRGLGGVRS